MTKLAYLCRKPKTLAAEKNMVEQVFSEVQAWHLFYQEGGTIKLVSQVAYKAGRRARESASHNWTPDTLYHKAYGRYPVDPSIHWHAFLAGYAAGKQKAFAIITGPSGAA
jgi:hypothetical protein